MLMKNSILVGRLVSYSLDSYLEEDASAEELSEDASDGPHVDGVGVVLGAHEDLGRAVVLRHHLLRHVLRAVLLLHPAIKEEYLMSVQRSQ